MVDRALQSVKLPRATIHYSSLLAIKTDHAGSLFVVQSASGPSVNT